jgi:glutamyl-tRNA synthetase
VSWNEEPRWQSRHRERYDTVIADLVDRDLVFECYCSRRDILNAPRAPHAPEGAYPGTCRWLTAAQRSAHRDAGRPPALRLRAGVREHTVTDLLHGPYTGVVDDFVLRRGDGVAAYNLAVVVDDEQSGIDQVVRGDDLLSSAPRQAYLATLLGYRRQHYAHVPLALNADGKRLAKRDGAVTLRELGTARAFAAISESLGWPAFDISELLAQFDPSRLPKGPWIYRPP